MLLNAEIQGIGFISPWGNKLEEFYKNYKNNTRSVRKIDRFETNNISTNEASLILDFEPKNYMNPKQVRKYDIFSQLGISAANLALKSSVQIFSEKDIQDMGIIFTCESQSLITAEYLEGLVNLGPEGVSPKLFTQASANSSNCHIAMETGIRGISINVSAKFASGFLAIFTGLQIIHSEQAENCMVGSIDYLSKVVMESYSKLGCYDNVQNGADGFLPGEGVASLILSKTNEGYGRILGIAYECSCEKNYRWPSDIGTHVRVLKGAMGEHSVNNYFTGANGNKIVDKLEKDSFKEAFNGKTSPNIISIKNKIGEFSAVPILQVIGACCEPKGTKSLISVSSPGGIHGAILIESTGKIADTYGN